MTQHPVTPQEAREAFERLCTAHPDYDFSDYAAVLAFIAQQSLAAQGAAQQSEGVQGLTHIRTRAQEVAAEWDCDVDLILGAFDKLLPCYLNDPTERHVVVPVDSLIRSDDYGVYGSTFYECRLCDAASGAGVLNKGIPHRTDCPLHESNAAPQPEAAPMAAQEGGEDAKDAVWTKADEARAERLYRQWESDVRQVEAEYTITPKDYYIAGFRDALDKRRVSP